MNIRFTARPGRAPVRLGARHGRGRARSHEREIMDLCVDKAHMPRAALHQGLPRQRNQPRVGRSRKSQADKPYSAAADARRSRPSSKQQQKLIDLQAARRHPDQGSQGHQQADVHRRSQGAPRQARNDRGQPAPGDLHRQEVHQPRPAVPRPDPGRQHRPDEGGGQVRIPPRLQVLDLRHVVDPPGHHALDRRPGAHHPHPGAHDRDHQQDEPHLAPDPAGDRPGARSGDAGR